MAEKQMSDHFRFKLKNTVFYFFIITLSRLPTWLLFRSGAFEIVLLEMALIVLTLPIIWLLLHEYWDWKYGSSALSDAEKN